MTARSKVGCEREGVGRGEEEGAERAQVSGACRLSTTDARRRGASPGRGQSHVLPHTSPAFEFRTLSARSILFLLNTGGTHGKIVGRTAR